MKIETVKECYAKRGYYPDENGQVMIRFNGLNYHLCKNLESAKQYAHDSFPSTSYNKITLIYWN